MKILLVGINSKYIHTNIAIRYLYKSVCKKYDSKFKEYTVNQPIEQIIESIYADKPDLLCFSAYIWNIEYIEKICDSIKKINPQIITLIGGPEVSFETESFLKKNEAVDYIIRQEGEIAFPEFCDYISHKIKIEDVHNLVYRKNNEILYNNIADEISMDILQMPYNYDEDLTDKIVYYEAQRGCPFKCAFCLSSTIKSLRFKNIEDVKKDIDFFINKKVKQVKFIDRTFNADEKFAISIIDYIKNRNPDNINFHFEITLDNLSEKFLATLKNAKRGLIQFEIGLQSTNEKTLKEINRRNNLQKIKENSMKIKDFNNIHQHIDLIAGLPYEDYDSFKKSFNYLYNFGIEKIQLGFLKMLKGCDLRINSQKYGYKYQSFSPYEVYSNNFISYDEIALLHKIDFLIDKYYNEGNFSRTLNIILNNYKEAFDMYEDMRIFFDEHYCFNKLFSKRELYKIIYEFYLYKNFPKREIFTDALSLDFYQNMKSTPKYSFMDNIEEMKSDEVFELLKNEGFKIKYLPNMINLRNKDIIKKIRMIKNKKSKSCYLIKEDEVQEIDLEV